MKKYDCKKNIRGITLVALIITIIVLLILAVTSITLIINQGILDKSNNATDSYSVSEMDEKVQLAYSEYNMTKTNNPSYTFKDALTAAGITIDKEVKDEETYQALKDDPDWFSTKEAYSRYNHTSAVNTINSLPDTSAYLATAGGTNTLKLKGASGSSTTAGGVNTLTEEEIAVATAKGWTVAFV